MILTQEKRTILDTIFKRMGYTDYKWIDSHKIIVSQWVRVKCKFGCSEYGHCGVCPPNTPSVAECREFFSEYSHAVLLHFEGVMDKPEDRHAWSRKINTKLVKLEREFFLAGNERAFVLLMDSCTLCRECAADRRNCEHPRLARPAPEAMAVDVYSTVRQYDFPIMVRTDYGQKMDRYAILLVQ